MTARLQRHHAGRPVVLGPGILAGLTPVAGRRNAALMAHLDETYGTTFGPLVPAPDLRTGGS